MRCAGGRPPPPPPRSPAEDLTLPALPPQAWRPELVWLHLVPTSWLCSVSQSPRPRLATAGTDCSLGSSPPPARHPPSGPQGERPGPALGAPGRGLSGAAFSGVSGPHIDSVLVSTPAHGRPSSGQGPSLASEGTGPAQQAAFPASPGRSPSVPPTLCA